MIRRLMVLFGLVKAPLVQLDVVRRRSIQSVTDILGNRRVTTSYETNRPEKVVSDIKDSDDDVSRRGV